MPGCYARLRDDWILRGWTDVKAALVNWKNLDRIELSYKELYVAESCDGRTDFGSFCFMPQHDSILKSFVDQGCAEYCRKGDRIEEWQCFRQARNPFIKQIQWAVTGLCNLNCKHCYMESPSGKYGQLPFAEIREIIEQFERANVIQVALTGGEPFMRKDLVDIIQLLGKKRIWISDIYTNGLLVTDKLLNEIKRIGFLPNFQISFDGLGGHDYMRGRGDIEGSVLAAIRRVRSAGFPVIVATNVDRVNAGCLEKTYEHLLDLDIQAWRIGTPLGMGNWRNATSGLTFDEETRLYEKLFRRWSADAGPFEIVLGLVFRGAKNLKPASAAGPESPYVADDYDCISSRTSPNLLPDGTLLPCPGYVDSVVQDRMPNIVREGLSKVWSGSLLRNLVDIKKSELLASNDDCKGCENFANCGAGCRASALRETGNLMAKDPIACALWNGQHKKRFGPPFS